MFSLLSSFIPSWNKIFIVVGIVGIIVAGYWYVCRLQNKLEEKTKQLVVMDLELQIQKKQVKQLEKDLQDTINHYKMIKQLDDKLINETNIINEQFEKYSNGRLRNIVKSKKAELMLKKINKQAECQQKNYFNYNITCVNGISK